MIKKGKYTLWLHSKIPLKVTTVSRRWKRHVNVVYANIGRYYFFFVID